LSCHPACAERQSNKAHLEKSQTFILHRQGGHSGSFERLEISLSNGFFKSHTITYATLNDLVTNVSLCIGVAIVAEFVEEVMRLSRHNI
jgi:hypothetical protein